MRTNLVFKRTVNIEGSSRTEMKIIEVNIPELKGNEGWTLVSSADKVEQVKLEEDKPAPINCDSTTDGATKFLNNLILNMSAASAQSNQEVIDESASQSVGVTEQAQVKIAAEMQVASVNTANVDVQDMQIKDEIKTSTKDVKKANFSRVREFESPISGTACLIRSGDTIRIAYREGKKANITTLNRICISDKDKQSFFNAVRACNPTSIISKWVLTPKDHHYKWWNEFMDNEYKEQRDEYIRKQRYSF